MRGCCPWGLRSGAFRARRVCSGEKHSPHAAVLCSPGGTEDAREDGHVGGQTALCVRPCSPGRFRALGPGLTYQVWQGPWQGGVPAAMCAGTGLPCSPRPQGGHCGAAGAPGAGAHRGPTRSPPAGGGRTVSLFLSWDLGTHSWQRTAALLMGLCCLQGLLGAVR